MYKFAPRGKIIYIHFRDVEGTPDNFSVCFMDVVNKMPALNKANAVTA